MSLKPNESVAYPGHTAKFRRGVADGPVSQLQKMRQLPPIKLANTLPDILRQDEVEKSLKLLCRNAKISRPSGRQRAPAA